MKELTSIIIFVVLFTALEAQSTFKYTYSYDESGNRETRTCILVSGSSAQSSLLNLSNDNKSSSQDISLYNDSISFSNIVIYPNPNYGELILKMDQIQQIKDGAVELYSVTGELLLKKDISIGYTHLDFSAIKPGNYILILKLGNQQHDYNIIRE